MMKPGELKKTLVRSGIDLTKNNTIVVQKIENSTCIIVYEKKPSRRNRGEDMFSARNDDYAKSNDYVGKNDLYDETEPDLAEDSDIVTSAADDMYDQGDELEDVDDFDESEEA